MKMVIFAVGMIFLSAAISTGIAYFYSRTQLESNLGKELLGITNSAVALINGDEHENIFVNDEGKVEGWDEFHSMKNALIIVKKNSGLRGHENSSPLYTMRKAVDYDKTKQLEFVVMTDKNKQGRYFIGARIKAEPHHEKAFKGKPAVTKIYKDVEGLWISAAVPIKNSNGDVVAILQADRPIQFFNQKLYELATQLFIGFFISILLASIIAFFFARRLVQPIKQLVTATEEFGKGDLSHKVDIKRRDEIGALANSFNTMAEKIRKHAENLQSLVDERTKDLRNMKEKAEAANRAKSTFLANMSHELRTPLNAIIGLSEMMLEDAQDEKAELYIEPLDRVNSAGKHLLQLINDILDLSKIEASKMELMLEDFDVHKLIHDVQVLAEPLAQKKQNWLEISNPDDLGEMHADSTKLKQVLLNLLSNACKFTEKGVIKLNAKRYVTGDTDWLCFEVVDSGIGMTQEQMSNIFQQFVQADVSTTRQYGGTGLGLAISKKMCQMMGGDITVSSEVGKGSTFTVKLPAIVVSKQARTAMPSLLAGSKKHKHITDKKIKYGKILIIEDDPTASEMMSHYLKEEGYDITIAATGEDGLKIAREQHPAIIILDIQLPGINGWDVLSLLKSSPETRNTLIIVVSVLDEKKRGFALGASDYLVKPVSHKELIDTVNKYRKNGNTIKVLVVDDDPGTRLLLRNILTKENCDVIEAENGLIALTKLEKESPGLVLLDLMMPVMDGFEFLEKMRKTQMWSSIPVVVITAKSLTQEDVDRLNGRVIQTLQKGQYSTEELRLAINNIITDHIEKHKPEDDKKA